MWCIPFINMDHLYSQPPGVAIGSYFQVNRNENMTKVTLEGVWGICGCPRSPGLEEPSLILMGLAKFTRIVRPKSSDSF